VIPDEEQREPAVHLIVDEAELLDASVSRFWASSITTIG
jgi:hypothetical protein